MKSLIAALLLGVSVASLHAESLPGDGPGSVFIAPEETVDQNDDDIELPTDLELFTSRGFTAAQWNIHDPLVAQVAKDLVYPEYEKRTGMIAPADGTIEIATAMITKQGFRDLLVMSRLPGDCRSDGCLIQVYSLVGQVWFKRLEFHALNAAWKDGTDAKKTTLVAVGDGETPTRLHYWDGNKFAE